MKTTRESHFYYVITLMTNVNAPAVFVSAYQAVVLQPLQLQLRLAVMFSSVQLWNNPALVSTGGMKTGLL